MRAAERQLAKGRDKSKRKYNRMTDDAKILRNAKMSQQRVNRAIMSDEVELQNASTPHRGNFSTVLPLGSCCHQS